VIIALVYTTPWDNYLVATGVWWYNPQFVTGYTLGWVPIEEYTFFILQTLLTGLWMVQMLRKIPPTQPRVVPRLRLWSSLVTAFFWLLSLGFWIAGWQSGTYLSLILAWALLPILLQFAFGADILLAHARPLLFGIGIPTLYLWAVDALAINSGTWTIDPGQTTGIKLGMLPMEEMLFFAVTNFIVAFGITLMCAPETQARIKSILSFRLVGLRHPSRGS
jgi:lycopene cyclase domain-containing protein